MISIIVSSYKPQLFEAFSNNVKATIGDREFEIIQMYNPGLMGICEAYNKGAAMAKYDYLVFCHEDVLYHTPNWGTVLVNAFKSDPHVGLIGVLGSRYKSYILSGWPIGFGTSMQMMHNGHGKRFYKRKTGDTDVFIDLNQHPESEAYTQVPKEIFNESAVVLDGMFLALPKRVHEEIKFDEQYKHFHCYDVDISIAVLQKYKVVVNHNILIEHFSSGRFDSIWFKDSLLLHQKWSEQLPCTTLDLSKTEVLNTEFRAFERLLHYVKNNRSDFWPAVKYLYTGRLPAVLGAANWVIFQTMMAKKLFKLLVKK